MISLELPEKLSEKLATAAMKEAKEPNELAIELLESVLDKTPLSFIGAWKDSKTNPRDIVSARTLGRNIELGN